MDERVRAAPASSPRDGQDSARGSRQRGAYEQWLEEYLPEFEILTVTEPTTLAYARVRVSLKKLGRSIPANDAWIAALALQHHLPVLSRDTHFDDVPGLRRETW